MFSVSNHSLGASIKPPKKVMWTRSKLNSKNTKPIRFLDCVQIISFYFLLGLNIMICVSNHSLVASIETKRKVMWTRSK